MIWRGFQQCRRRAPKSEKCYIDRIRRSWHCHMGECPFNHIACSTNRLKALAARCLSEKLIERNAQPPAKPGEIPERVAELFLSGPLKSGIGGFLTNVLLGGRHDTADLTIKAL